MEQTKLLFSVALLLFLISSQTHAYDSVTLWAHGDSDDVLEWSGSETRADGLVHSNGGIKLGGSDNIINGATHWVTKFENGGGNNYFSSSPVKVSSSAWPFNHEVIAYQPGGRAALAAGDNYFDESTTCNQNGKWERDVQGTELEPGLYWVPCDVVFNASNLTGQITIVSTGKIEVSGSDQSELMAFTDGVLFFTQYSGDDAIKLSGSSSTMVGFMLAPQGRIETSGSDLNLTCGLLAEQIKLNGSNLHISGEGCAVPYAEDGAFTTPENTPVDIQLVAGDLDNDLLTYQIIDIPLNGQIVGDGSDITYIPNTGYYGTDTLTFKVTDGVRDSNTATVTIEVIPVNDAPLADDQSVTTPEDTPVDIVLTGSDPDGDALAYTVVTQPAHGTLTGDGATLQYTPNADYTATDTFTFMVNDGQVDSSAATVSIEVTPVNDAPVADDQSVTTPEDTAVDIVLTGSDPDGDSLTYTVVTLPANGVLSGDAPNLQYTPNADYNGPDTFTFMVNDGQVDSSAATVSIEVTPVNDAPVADDQSVTTPEDTAVDIVLTGSDSDGDALTYTVVTQPANGVLTGDAPNLQYTPNVDYTGIDTFTFMVNDGQVDSNTATVSIEVTPVNDAPLADDQSVTTPEDTPVDIVLTGSDPDGDALTYTIITQPANGVLSGDAPNLQYTPNADYNGPDTFTFMVNDGQVDSNTATVSIEVTPVNDAPVADDQSVTTPEDTPIDIVLTGSDPDGDSLTYTVVTLPANGVLSGDAPNLQYTPNVDYNGPDTFTFMVNDGQVDSNTATVSIEVTPVNDAPLADDQSVTTPEDTPIDIVLTGSDPDGDALTYTIITQPANGVLSGDAPNLQYTPNADYNGPDTFTFMVNDGQVDSNTATVSIEVTPVNDVPLADDQSVTTPEDTAVDIILTGSDPDGDALTYTIITQPANGVLSGDAPNLQYTPNADYTGTDTFTFVANDGQVDSNTATVSIEVTPVDNTPIPPVVCTPFEKATIGTEYKFEVLQQSSLSSDLRFNILTGPSGLGVNGLGVVTWTPEDGQEGIHPVSIEISSTSNSEVLVESWEIEVNALEEAIGPKYVRIDSQSLSDIYKNVVVSELPKSLDFCLVVDVSGSYGDDISNIKNKAPEIFEEIKKSIPDSRFCLATFSDYPIGSFGGGFDYAYRLNGDLTPVREYWLSEINDIRILGGGDGPESQLEALYQLVSGVGRDIEPLGLSTGDIPVGHGASFREGAAKIIAITTDASFHDSENHPGPTISETVSVLQDAGVSVVAVKAPGASIQMDLLAEQTNGVVVETSSDSSEIADAIVNGVKQIARDVTHKVESCDSAELAFDVDSVELEGRGVAGFVELVTPIGGSGNCVVSFHSGGEFLGFQEINICESWVENYPPVILSTPSTQVHFDDEYYYPIVASDENGDQLDYLLLRSPDGMNITPEGEISWNPLMSQVGVHSIQVSVNDGRGGEILHEWNIEVGDINRPPVIVSTPADSINVYHQFSYYVIVNDPDGDPFTLNLITAPPGMVLDNQTILWTPSEALVSHTIQLEVIDSEGAVGAQSFDVFVTPNPPPVFTSEPDLLVPENHLYRYIMSASDPDSDRVSYRLLSGPVGMNVSGNVLSWTADSPVGSVVAVAVEAVDQFGAADQQEFLIEVTSNQPPVITSTPTYDALAGRQYLYSLTGSDPDGDSLIYTLLSGPDDMVLTGRRLTWTPLLEHIGSTFSVTVQADDQYGGTTTQSFDILVDGNKAPEFTSTPGFSARVGAVYTYRVTATDPDGDYLITTLETSPEGMTISGNYIRWTPTIDQVGDHEIVITVDDRHGAIVSQSYVLSVRENQPPEFTSTPIVSVVDSHRYSYYVSAIDPDLDPLYYSLTTFPNGMTLSGRRIDWTPRNDQLGPHAVVVSVDDRKGGVAEQRYTVTVTENRPPRFTSSPTERGITGHSYTYNMYATDPDGDAITYSLLSGPEGMTFSGRTLRWTPGGGQLGEHAIEVMADDRYGLTSTQVFNVTVYENQAPEIISEPVTNGRLGQLYLSNVRATDPDGDAVQYRLLSGPAGLTISAYGQIRWNISDLLVGQHEIALEAFDQYGGVVEYRYELTIIDTELTITKVPANSTLFDSELFQFKIEAAHPDGRAISYEFLTSPTGASIVYYNGQMEWTPTVDQLGSHDFTVRAYSSDGLEDTATFTLTVELNTNQAPVITSTPVTSGMTNSGYQYLVTATDAEGHELSYSVENGPAGLRVNSTLGLVTWDVPNNSFYAGTHSVTIRVTDERGKFTEQTYDLNIELSNVPPRFYGSPNTVGKIGFEYRYEVDARDANNDVLSYSLDTAPDGMTVSQDGIITWQPTEVGVFSVELVVSDAEFTAVRLYQVTVSPELPSLSGSLTLTPEIVDPDERVLIDVTALNGTGTVTAEALIDGTEVLNLYNLRGYYTTAVPGNHSVVVTISDAYETYTITDSFRVRDGDLDPPVVEISSIDYDQIITQPVEVIGSVSDANLASWELVLKERGAEPSDFLVLAEGTSNVDNQGLVTLDPSTLLNGQYVLILQAVDQNGQSAHHPINIIIEGDLKVGNFSISFEDLSLDTAGIPITVTRTYDTRQRYKSLDFGQGWSLGFENTRIHENRVPGYSWLLRTYPKGPLGLTPDVCVESTTDNIVSVTLPDGDVKKFKAVAVPECNTVTPILDVHLEFEAMGDDNGAKLEALNNKYGRLLDGSIQDIGVGPVDPTIYKLTTKEGRELIIDQTEGVKEIFEPEGGNRVTISKEGIVHSAGPTVSFVRDAQDRITRITSPNGKSISYSYDENGDLVAVSDLANEVTTFTYLANPNLPHYLEDIIDPRGVRVARNEYDDDGRLSAHIDADGNRIEYTHDITGRTESVQDRLGNTMVYVYNERGDVVAETNAEGETITHTYDAYGNELSRTDALGNTTSWTYDNLGNQLTETDALGNTSSSTYEHYNRIDTETDVLGRSALTTFYRNTIVGGAPLFPGPLASMTVPAGTIGMGYNYLGLVSSVTDVGGNQTRTEYNASGYVTAIIDELGVRTDYTVDEVGNRLTETTTRTDENGDLITQTTTYEYDDRNNLIQTTDALGNVTRSEYNEINKLSAEIDANGNRTEYEYDSRGNQSRIVFADGSTQTTNYDAENNKLSETDRLGNTTYFAYDKANRLVETILPDSTPGDLTDNPRSRTEYDLAGRVSAEIDANGNRTSYGYDALGRRSSMTDALGNISTYVYDAVGNQTSFTDARSMTTSYEYDSSDRRTRTIFPDGTSIQVAYDALGRKISETNQAGVITQYAYDAKGRLVKVTDALSNETAYAYDEQGNKISQTDAEGRVTQWAYDNLGRIISRTLPMGQVETMAYDAVGNMISQTDFNGQTTTHSYDTNHRRTLSTYADGMTESFVYDAMGNRTQVVKTDNGVTITTNYTYDAQNRLASETQFAGSAEEVSLSYVYAANGNRLSVTQTDASETRLTSYSYDALNRMQSVTDPDANQTTYQYDAVGNRTGVDHANGNQDAYVYDALNRLTTLTRRDSSNAITQQFSYTLEPTGRRMQISEYNGRTTLYTYDTLYRLTTENITDLVNGNYNAAYTYDKVGNRTYETINGVSTAYTVDANDRLTQAGTTAYTYDANGNTLTESEGGNTTTYAYNAKNEMVGSSQAGQTTVYLYNADGIRVIKRDVAADTQTWYTVDSNRDYAQVLSERTDGATDVSYTYGDDLISQRRGSDTSVYHYDGLGSARALSDAAGNITDTYNYAAFGEKLNETGSTENDYLYTGEQYDGNLDQYYLRARYYDQNIGRFTQQDTWMGNSQDPITLHKYLYANVDPVGNVDPSGNFSLGGLMSGVGGFARLATTATINIGRRAIGKTLSVGLMVSGRVFSKTALRELKRCVKNKKKCSLGANILLVGFNHPNMLDHIRDAQSTRPRTFVLNYMPNKKREGSWYLNKGDCALPKPSNSYQCDEYPMQRTREGGSRNWPQRVSLRWVPGSENMSVGGYFGVLAKGMKKSKKYRFVVITTHSLPTAALPLAK